MTPLTIQLDDEVAEMVQHLAVVQNRNESELIRDALALYVRTEKPPLPEGMGRYSSGRRDVSTKARELVREAVEKGQWP